MIKKNILISENKYLENFEMSNSNEIVIGPIAKINVFVGANNSGKSRLLRELSKYRTKVQYDEISSKS